MLSSISSSVLITPEEASESGATIIDVRSSEGFLELHVKGATNICVYEVSFADKVREAYPDASGTLVVYGQNDKFKAAPLAASTLSKMGYDNVRVLQGGLEAWVEKGLSIELDAVEQGVYDGQFRLAKDKSRLRWIGRNLLNQHDGELSFESGYLTIDGNGDPISGEITVDMNSMTCRDLDDRSLSSALVAHLCSIDFFDSENFPTAVFKLQRFYLNPDARRGELNASVEGIMTVRGCEQHLAIEGLLAPHENGYVFQTQFDLDRTLFGAVYGSGKFFEKLGKHLVNDLVNLQITAVFER